MRHAALVRVGVVEQRRCRHVGAEERRGIGREGQPGAGQRRLDQAGDRAVGQLEQRLHVQAGGQRVVGRRLGHGAEAVALRDAGTDGGRRLEAAEGQPAAGLQPQHEAVCVGALDAAGERGADGRARRQEEVGAERDGGGLVGARARRRGQPRLAVAAHRHAARRGLVDRPGGAARAVRLVEAQVVAERREVQRHERPPLEPVRERAAGRERHALDAARQRREAAGGPPGGGGHGLGHGLRGIEQAPLAGEHLLHVGVVGRELRLRLARHRADGRPREQQGVHRLDLVLRQRQHAVEAAQQRRHALDGPRGVGVQRGAGGDGGLAGDPGARDVAEVDHAARHEAAAPVAAGDDVPLGRVAVDHGAPQGGAEPLEHGAEALGGPLDLRVLRRVVHLAEQRGDDVGGVLQVPLQEPLGGGMVEVREPDRHGRGRGADALEERVGQVVLVGDRLALDPGHEPHVERRAGPLDRHDLAPVARRQRHRRLQREPLRGQVVHRRVLQHERVAPEAGVRDLEDRARAVVVEQDVLVLLRPELAWRPADAEVLLCDRHGLGMRELGVRQREAGEGVARRHRPRR